MGEARSPRPVGGGQLLQRPGDADRWTADGWFKTGDVASIDAEGYVKIADRSKDLIKSGGEWISSVDLENELMGHPAVREAAVIGVPHPKWQERPLAVVVVKEGARVTPDELRRISRSKICEVAASGCLRFHCRASADVGWQAA